MFGARLSRVFLLLPVLMFAAAPASAKKESYLPKKEYQAVKTIYEKARAGNFTQAEKDASDRDFPVLARMVRWMRYRSPGAFRNGADVADALKLFSAWPELETIQSNIEFSENALDASVYAMLFSAYEPVTPGGKIIAFRLREAMKKKTSKENIALFREGWREFLGEDGQEAAIIRAHGKYITPNDLKQKIVFLLQRGAYSDAGSLISRISDSKERRYFELAKQLAQKKKSFRKVWDELDKKGRRHYLFVPRAVKRDISAKKFDNAYKRFEGMIEADTYNFMTKDWWKLRSRVARELFDMQEYDKSYRIVSRHLFPESAKEYPEAEWMAGWLALVFLDKPEKAARHFKNMSEQISTPISKGRAYYWLGRAYTSAGNLPGAKAAFDLASKNKATFYGQVAHLHLDDTSLDIPHRMVISKQEQFKAEGSPFVRAAQIWHDLGKRSMYYLFMQHAIKQAESSGARAAIAALPFQLDDIRDGVELGRYAYRVTGDIPVNAAYPILPRKAQRHSDKPEVVHGIILQESRFHVGASSHVGASGLMQVMPATAKEVARSLGIKGNIVKKLHHPTVNVQLGSAYIDTLLQEFGGSRAMALAAYNAGGSRVRNWMKRFGNPLNAHSVKQIINWIEIIPFYETRNYVQRVIENINVYTVLTRKKPLKITAELFL